MSRKKPHGRRGKTRRIVSTRLSCGERAGVKRLCDLEAALKYAKRGYWVTHLPATIFLVTDAQRIST
jgi:hypothetical protein